MAVQQDSALQQPVEAGQQAQAASSAPNIQPISGQPAQAQQLQTNGMSQGQNSNGQSPLSQLLEQQIAQAIQPVLDEFRQQMAQTLEPQASATPNLGQNEQSAQSPTQPAQPGQPAQPVATPGGEQQPLDQVAQATQQASAPLTQQAQHLEQQAQPSAVTNALAPALQTVERQGAEWFQSMLVAGLAALLTESTRAAIQQQAEQGLHALLSKLFAAAPGGQMNAEMQAKTEGALQLILRESLDATFSENMRGTVLQGGKAAIQESFHGEFSEALTQVMNTLKTWVEALLTALRRQWQTVLRLALALVLLALEHSLEQSTVA